MSYDLFAFIVDRVDVGIFAVDRSMRVILWNRFMEIHSARDADQVLGKNLFECFPELPRRWLEKKIHGVFTLKNFAFTSWEQRPHLFRFKHNRPITGGADFMYQSCTFMPVKYGGDDVEAVCVTLFDATDTGIYRKRLDRAMASLKESVNRDGLTGIFNRRCLESELSKEFDRCRRYGSPLSLILFDLDDFKRINDTHGHLAGDEVLRVIAQRVAKNVRSMDIFGRYGGEEFVVILPATDLDGAEAAAEKLRSIVAATPVTFGEQRLAVSASFGIAEAAPDLTSYEALLDRADSALYLCKSKGRNCVMRPAAAATPAAELAAV
ncbi:MAG TPA: diguanylate cyclase [Burkholderiales bacterium]|nr:diguanylate cyclase [Burkholderiales bacterium]